MNQDEQIALLKEIRDILLSQNELVDAQWGQSNAQWDQSMKESRNQSRKYEKAMGISHFQWWCFIGLQIMVVLYLFGVKP